jgi:gas vesicle protein
MRKGMKEKLMSRFIFGFVIGVLIGAATVIFAAPRSGAETLRGIRGLLDESVSVGKQASAAREQELWAQFRTRIAKKD